MEKIDHSNKHFLSEENDGIFHRLSFQGYCCKSGIAIFA